MMKQLDAASLDSPVGKVGKSKFKLKQNLSRKAEPEMSESSQGMLDAVGEDIRDHLNEFLNSATFMYLFKDVPKSSTVIEFVHVKANRDYSSVIALWQSKSLDYFAAAVLAKMGPEEAEKFCKRSVENVEAKLKKKVGPCRSYLMRKMDFKRVPQLTFRPHDPHLGLQLTEEPNWRNLRERPGREVFEDGDDDDDDDDDDDEDDDGDWDDEDEDEGGGEGEGEGCGSDGGEQSGDEEDFRLQDEAEGDNEDDDNDKHYAASPAANIDGEDAGTLNTPTAGIYGFDKVKSTILRGTKHPIDSRFRRK
jgi:hypothetical protein